ncbi:uncharacterized protein LOC109861055 [Pseudomyrmex gracilis]|uniref:uncharacterized protein LOC109861055 n=1 Tax=Pseudomyrmex gracilis TaxID=219809 RepID=UPI0009956B74|nr:uncharacterized protein LOC109861055 [Pseudomyrmex gracilis]
MIFLCLSDDNNEVEICADLCAEGAIKKDDNNEVEIFADLRAEEMTTVGLHIKAALNTITNTYTPCSAKHITQLYKQDIKHVNHLDSLQGCISGTGGDGLAFPHYLRESSSLDCVAQANALTLGLSLYFCVL